MPPVFWYVLILVIVYAVLFRKVHLRRKKVQRLRYQTSAIKRTKSRK
jgi:hypothetical protein